MSKEKKPPSKTIRLKGPQAEAYRAHVRRLQERKAVAEKFVTGQRTKDGIYLDSFTLYDETGRDLSRVFNIFAAPEDLTGADGQKVLFSHAALEERVAALTDWHGFKGEWYETDGHLFAALVDGRYQGGWVVPPRAIYNGRQSFDAAKKFVVLENALAEGASFFDVQDTGAFKDTFRTATAAGRKTDVYWSSSVFISASSYLVGRPNLAGGGETWLPRDDHQAACRPVRLVEVTR